MGTGPADALTDPRSFRIFPVGRSEEVLIQARGSRCRRRSKGRVDLAVVATKRRSLGPALKDAQENARVVVVPRPEAGDLPLPPDGALVLGTGSGIWTPNLRVGIAAPLAPRLRRTAHCRSCLIVTEGPSVATELVRAASARSLPLLAAVCTGKLPRETWIDLVLSLSKLNTQPLVLLALHRPIAYGSLHRIVKACSRVAILLLGAAGSHGALPGPTELELPDNRAIALALGLPVVETPEELVEYAWLLSYGVRRRSGRVLTTTDAGPDEAAVIEEAVAQAGLSTVSGRERSADLVLIGPLTQKPSARANAPTLRFSPTTYPKDGVVGRATLKAAAALLMEDLALARERATTGRPRAKKQRALQLLDGSPAELHELQVKELLACYSLPSPQEVLVTSPSRAGLVTARLGPPVVVKAVAPGLYGEQRRRTTLEDVESVSGCREAFHRVLRACSRLSPPPALEGILVSSTQDLTTTLECALLWPPPADQVDQADRVSPPLMTMRVWSGTQSSSVLVRALPLSPKAAQQVAERLARLGLANRRGALTSAQVRALARFLHRLSWVGPDLADRMRWLWIETVSPPIGRSPPLVVDACAEQTESYRAPDYMTW